MFLRSSLALVLFAGCAPALKATAPDTAAVTTVIVVRHAEKGTEPKADPPLTAAGEARAQVLIDTIGGLPVAAIVSTDFARTRSTVAPLAAKLGLTTELADARAPDHAKQVADSVLSKHRGATVVVVGHSNTVPDIVAALGAPKPAEICDGEFDNFFVVTVPASGAATVEQRKYGAQTNDASCRH